MCLLVILSPKKHMFGVPSNSIWSKFPRKKNQRICSQQGFEKKQKKKTRTSVQEFSKENCLRIKPQAMLSTRFLEVF
jgi:hypothetical protein